MTDDRKCGSPKRGVKGIRIEAIDIDKRSSCQVPVIF